MEPKIIDAFKHGKELDLGTEAGHKKTDRRTEILKNMSHNSRKWRI